MNQFLTQIEGTLTQPSTTSRREALRLAGRAGLAGALAAIPLVGLSKPAMAAANGVDASAFGMDDVSILNYALTLEYLERAFYNRGYDAATLIPTADRPLFMKIRDDERAHVSFLSNAISAAGGTPVSYSDSDFTFVVGGTDALTDYTLFKVVAQAFEDTGVRAYKGQAANITTPAYLTAALKIHSVEARHAAAIRKLNGNTAWIPGSQSNAPAAIAPVYGAGSPATDFPSEANTTQAGVSLLSINGHTYTAQEASEAFDEPLDMGTVLAIAGPFINS